MGCLLMSAELDVESQSRLVASLASGAWAGEGDPAEVVETHVSWVLLTPECAYKIKKALKFPFLDFSTLQRRRFCCSEEVRLNSRLAPGIYKEAVAIGGSVDEPGLGAAPAIEYAVSMKRFPAEDRLDEVLARTGLRHGQLRAFAWKLHECQRQAAVASVDSPYGSVADLRVQHFDNFAEISPCCRDASAALLEEIRLYSEQAFARLAPVMEGRRAAGKIREGHGDLHLGNLLLHEGEIAAFDCIEFNPSLSWIDGASDLAFMVMDLRHRRQPQLARTLLSSWAEASGDYGALAVMRLYLVYRALVRAKIDCIRRRQVEDEDEARKLAASMTGYLQLAADFIDESGRGPLILMHGPSGCGKSYCSSRLVSALGAMRLRSDLERRRLPAEQFAGGLYSAPAIDANYRRLIELAETVIDSGWPVIVDATFLNLRHRKEFRDFAARAGVPLCLLSLTASRETIRRRLDQRALSQHRVSEAFYNTYEMQQSLLEPLTADEPFVEIDTESEADTASLVAAVQRAMGAGAAGESAVQSSATS